MYNPAEQASTSQLRQIGGRKGSETLAKARHPSHRKAKASADLQLIDSLLQGDRGAFDRFFDENAVGLYRFALPRLDYDEELAKEITQTALCKAIAKIETFRGDASLFTWLCSCCKYEILGHFKNRARQPDQVELDEEITDFNTSDSGLVGPEAEAQISQTQGMVHLTLDQIPNEYAEILELKYIEEASVKEIASRLGVSPKAAESKLTRAREAFRRHFRVVSTDPGAWAALRMATVNSKGGPQ